MKAVLRGLLVYSMSSLLFSFLVYLCLPLFKLGDTFYQTLFYVFVVPPVIVQALVGLLCSVYLIGRLKRRNKRQ